MSKGNKLQDLYMEEIDFLDELDVIEAEMMGEDEGSSVWNSLEKEYERVMRKLLHVQRKIMQIEQVEEDYYDYD